MTDLAGWLGVTASIGVPTVGAIWALWWKLNGRIDETRKEMRAADKDLDKRLDSERDKLKTELAREQTRNAQQQTELELIKQRLADHQTGVLGRLDKLDGRFEKLGEKLETHMDAESKTLEAVLNRWAGGTLRAMIADEIRTARP